MDATLHVEMSWTAVTIALLDASAPRECTRMGRAVWKLHAVHASTMEHGKGFKTSNSAKTCRRF